MNKATKNIKREAAEQRQAKYDALSVEQKLERLDSRPGQAQRERAKLEKQR